MSRTADSSAQQARLSQAVWDVLAEQGIERLTIRAVATDGDRGDLSGLEDPSALDAIAAAT